MNKWRLLLLSIFALLQITTSERIFFNGRNECCDHTRQSLFGTRLPVYDSYRENRYSNEIRKLNTREKYSTTDVSDADISDVSRRSVLERREQRLLNNRLLQEGNRRVIARHRTRLLSSIPEIARDQISRERINERTNDFQTSFREDRFSRQPNRLFRRDARITARNDLRMNSITETLFETRQQRQLNDDNYNNRDNRFTEQGKRRNTLNKDFNGNADPRAVREEAGLRKSNERNVNDNLSIVSKRNSRLTMRQNERSDYSREQESSRIAVRSNTVEYEVNRRINPTIRRSLPRNIEEAAYSEENRERTARTVIRADNLHRRASRITKNVVFRRTREQQRDYSQNRLEKTVRNNDEQQRIIDGNDEFSRFDRRQMQRRSLDSERHSQSQRRSNNYNVRANTIRIGKGIPKRSLSEESIINRVFHIEPRKNIDIRNLRQHSERRNTLESRFNYNREKEDSNRRMSRLNEDKYLDGKNVRESTVIRSEIRPNMLQTNARDNKIIETRLNVRDAVRVKLTQSYSTERIVDNAAIRMTRRIREVFDFSRENHERRNLIESRQVSLRERRVLDQVKRNTITPKIVDNFRRDRFENEFRMRIKREQNRMSLTIRVNTAETEQNERIIDNERSLVSERFNNEDRLTRRQNRNVREESRNTKNIEEKRIDMRKITTYTERFSTAMTKNQKSIQIQPTFKQTDVFEVKWQYLFYIVQALYLCSLLIRIPKDNDGAKRKLRYTNLLTSVGFIKID